MSSLSIALIVVGVIAAGGLVGLVFSASSGPHTDKPRDMIGGVVGHLTLLLALVSAS